MKTIKIIITVLFSTVTISNLQATDIASFPFPADGLLNEEMRQSYATNGFILLDGFLSEEGCQALRAAGDKLVEEVDTSATNLTIFTTDDTQNVHLKDAYFTESSDKVRPFFESMAVKDGKLVVDKAQAINKFAHALGEQNEAFRNITFQTHVGDIAQALGVKEPRLAQSMLILKPAKTGGVVLPHQDAIFIHSNPHNELGYWMPLVPATKENSCLWVIPGSHKFPLIAHYVKNPDGPGFIFVDIKDDQPIKSHEYFQRIQETHWPQSSYVPVEMKAGSLLVFHSHLVHQSSANTSDQGRAAYTFHVIDGESKWDERNWLQRKEFAKLPTSK